MDLKKSGSDSFGCVSAGHLIKFLEFHGNVHIITVELKMGYSLAQEYHDLYVEIVADLVTDEEDFEEEPIFTSSSHRRLIAGTTNMQQDRFFTRGYLAKKYLDKLFVDCKDDGAAYYHKVTKDKPYLPPYLDRLSQAHYMTALSVKKQYIIGKITNLCVAKNEKLVVFVDSSLSVWDYFLLSRTLCIETLMVRGCDTKAVRDDTVRTFNDPNDPSRLLIASASESVQKLDFLSCRHMIIAEFPSSGDTLLQTIGLIRRHGQHQEVFIEIVTADNTYDQILQSRMAKAIMAQMARHACPTVWNNEVSSNLEKNGVDKSLWADLRELARAAVVDEKVLARYCDLFGIRSDRRQWGSVDLAAKDYLPGESKANETPPKISQLRLDVERLKSKHVEIENAKKTLLDKYGITESELSRIASNKGVALAAVDGIARSYEEANVRGDESMT